MGMGRGYLRTYDFFKIVSTFIKDSKDGVLDNAIKDVETELVCRFKDECDATIEYLNSDDARSELIGLVMGYRELAINEAKRRLSE